MIKESTLNQFLDPTLFGCPSANAHAFVVVAVVIVFAFIGIGGGTALAAVKTAVPTAHLCCSQRFVPLII